MKQKRKHTESNKSKRTSPSLLRTLFIVFIALASPFVCLVLSLLFIITNTPMLCFGTLMPSTGHVEALGRFELPSSASNFTYDIEDTSGTILEPICELTIQFEMSPTDLSAFQSSTMFEHFRDMRDIDPPYKDYDAYFPHTDWYYNEAILAQNGNPSSWVDQWMVVDTSDAETWTVYIIVIDVMWMSGGPEHNS